MPPRSTCCIQWKSPQGRSSRVRTSNFFNKAGSPAASTAGDRTDRARAMPWLRRLLDRTLVAPRLKAIERRILAGPGSIYGASHYTARALLDALDDHMPSDQRPRIGHLPVPVDVMSMVPPERAPRPGVVGFAGRLNDPRKNVIALVEAVALARAAAVDVRAILTGADPDPGLRSAVQRLGLAEHVEFLGEVDRPRLQRFYREIDIFVIPSHQEGLCIAGVEAMACGVPVVSTRCGGPEDYVRPDQTGFLVGSRPEEIAARITQIARDRSLRERMSKEARMVAKQEYCPDVYHRNLNAAWRSIWNEDL